MKRPGEPAFQRLRVPDLGCNHRVVVLGSHPVGLQPVVGAKEGSLQMISEFMHESAEVFKYGFLNTQVSDGIAFYR